MKLKFIFLKGIIVTLIVFNSINLYTQDSENLKSSILISLNENLVYEENGAKQFFMFNPPYDEVINKFTKTQSWFFEDKTLIFIRYEIDSYSLFYLFDFRVIDGIEIAKGRGRMKDKLIILLNIDRNYFYKVKNFLGDVEMPYEEEGRYTKVSLFLENDINKVISIKNRMIQLAQKEGFNIKDLTKTQL